MLKLRDIMTRDVLALSPDASLREAVSALAARHVSGAPVLAGRQVVGVLSVSDILDFESTTPAVPSGRTERADWDPFGDERWTSPEDDAGAPPEENEPPATFYTDLWADAGADVVERFGQPVSPEWDLLGEHTVSEAMTRDVQALPPGASIAAAAERMRRLGIHRVLVMRGGVLEGIVTTLDVARAVADHTVARSRQAPTPAPRRPGKRQRQR